MITYGSILAVYFSATDKECTDGERWYADAISAAQTIAQRYSLSVHTVAGVIAALSPNNKWERNLTDADMICKVYTLGGNIDALKVSTFGANKAKAIAILSGAEPLAILGGLKVRAFYDCIIGGDSVCVDGHAYSIWLGQRIAIGSTPKISPKLYSAIVADYRLACAEINRIMGTSYNAAAIQAISWLVWRRLVREAN